MAERYRLWLFMLLLGIFLLGLTDVQMISPILPRLAKDFSVSPAMMGTAVSAYAMTAAIWALMIGPLSDQIGRLIFLRAAAFIFAGAALVAYFAAQFEHYLLARVLAGLAGGTISACVIAQVADLFDYAARGRAMGWLGAIYFIAAVFAVPLGAWITSVWGWRILYVALAGFAFMIGLLIRPRSFVAAAQQLEAKFDAAQFQRQLKNYGHYLAEKRTLSGLLLAMMVSSTVAGVVTYLGLWLNTAFAMTLATIGVVFMVTGVTSVIGALCGGWLSDKLGKRQLIAGGSLLLALVLCTAPLVQNRTGVFIFCAAGGLAMALREGPFQALISELAPAAERGAYIALRNALSQLAIAAAVAICGLLFERTGFHAIAYFAAGCSVVACGLAWWIVEPARK